MKWRSDISRFYLGFHVSERGGAIPAIVAWNTLKLKYNYYKPMLNLPENTTSIKLKKAIAIFVAAITCYFVSYVISLQFEIIDDKKLSILQFTFLAAMLYASKDLLTDFRFENLYFKYIFFIFMAYQLVLIARGFELNYQIVKNIVQTDFIFWPSVIPFAIFFDKTDLTFFYLIKSFFLLAIIFLFCSILDPFLVIQRVTSEPFVLTFAFTAGFLFLNAKYLSRKVSWIAFISLLVGLVSFVYLARRNAIISFGSLLITGLYIMLRNFSISKFIKFIPVIAGLFIFSLYIFDRLPDSLTQRLKDRVTEDSRSFVFENLFKGLKNEMAFGKGINGNYYSPMDDELTEDGIRYGAIEYRNVIENGYLQLLLNGGYLNIVLFVLITFPAAFLGIFKSKNQLSRSCGVVVLLWLMDMAIYGLPRLLLEYILVWISVGICYSQSFRNKSEEEITESFRIVGLN
jgi:hypothetical protein